MLISPLRCLCTSKILLRTMNHNRRPAVGRIQLPKSRRTAALRNAEKGAQIHRAEYFERLLTEGVEAMEAYKRSNIAFQKILGRYIHETERRWVEAISKHDSREFGANEMDQLSKDFVENELRMIFENKSHFMDRLEARKRSSTRRKTYTARSNEAWAVNPDPKWNPIFSEFHSDEESKKKPLHSDEESDIAKPHSLQFWADMDTNKALTINRSMGPTNSFEEQIEWTKQGRMWPYPIDNEWNFGSTANVPFTEHVFLKPVWENHCVPKSHPVEHFMELVLTGLSKNPYMTASKKREHIKWFADYFREAIEGRYEALLMDESGPKKTNQIICDDKDSATITLRDC